MLVKPGWSVSIPESCQILIQLQLHPGTLSKNRELATHMKPHLHICIQVSHQFIWTRNLRKTKVMYKLCTNDWVFPWQLKPSFFPMGEWISSRYLLARYPTRISLSKEISLICHDQEPLAFLKSWEILLNEESFESESQWKVRSVRKYTSRSRSSSLREIVHTLLENGSWDGKSKDVEDCHLWYLFLNQR